MQDPIIYLHIPKTAGTSFRVSAEEYFGEHNILRDYGADSSNTSADIIESLLCGHFSLPRYSEVFPDSPIMTFFRNPVNRVVSEFVHFTNHYGYTETLEEMFNQRYGTELKMTELNIGTYSPRSVVKPTAKQIEEILHLNQADLTLYKQALEFFDQQPETKRTTASMAIRYRGNFGGIKNNGLCGWVTDTQTNAPINLRIAVNGVVLKTVTADRKRPDIVRNEFYRADS